MPTAGTASTSTSGQFLSVHDLEQTLRDGSDTVVDTTGTYDRVNALGWGAEVLADLFAGTTGNDTLNGTPGNDTIMAAPAMTR